MTTGPELLERTRMALAEDGHDPSLVWLSKDDPTMIHGSWLIPAEAGWRALSIAKGPTDEQTCWACSGPVAFATDEKRREAKRRCDAYLPLTEDCGIDRGDQ